MREVKLFPIRAAIARQKSWDRLRMTREMKDADMTLELIGDVLGVSRERVRQMLAKWEREKAKVPPLVDWLGREGGA